MSIKRDNTKVKVVAEKGARLPVYKTAGSSGADVQAFIPEPIVIRRGERALIPTGLYFEIPEGYEIQVRPRSGLALKSGVTVLNTPGTIDSDYRGELRVILANFGDSDFTVNNGDRIAQLVLCAVDKADFLPSETVSQTGRGAGGFGSTGVAPPAEA